MANLKDNWLTDGHIDFEYKKYLLLAYFQKVERQFNSKRLYPMMGELVLHYQSIMKFKTNRDAMKQQIHGDLKGIDWKTLQLIYDHQEAENAYFSELEKILDFAIPRFEDKLEKGRDIYDTVENNIDIFPVGLVSIYQNEGFFILNSKKNSFVFHYKMGNVQVESESYRSLGTSYLGHYKMDIATTYNSIRKDLVRTFTEFDNPATYVVEVAKQVPIKETFLPVAKRSLLKYILAA